MMKLMTKKKQRKSTKTLPIAPGRTQETQEGTRADNYGKVSPETHLRQILSDRELAGFYKRFLDIKYCGEILSFWLAVEEYKRQKDFTKAAEVIVNKFLTRGAENEVNLDMDVHMAEVRQKIDNGADRDLFDKLQKAAFQLQVHDSYPKFVASKQYRDYLGGMELQPPLTRTASVEHLYRYCSRAAERAEEEARAIKFKEEKKNEKEELEAADDGEDRVVAEDTEQIRMVVSHASDEAEGEKDSDEEMAPAKEAKEEAQQDSTETKEEEQSTTKPKEDTELKVEEAVVAKKDAADSAAADDDKAQSGVSEQAQSEAERGKNDGENAKEQDQEDDGALSRAMEQAEADLAAAVEEGADAAQDAKEQPPAVKEEETVAEKEEAKEEKTGQEAEEKTREAAESYGGEAAKGESEGGSQDPCPSADSPDAKASQQTYDSSAVRVIKAPKMVKSQEAKPEAEAKKEAKKGAKKEAKKEAKKAAKKEARKGARKGAKKTTSEPAAGNGETEATKAEVAQASPPQRTLVKAASSSEQTAAGATANKGDISQKKIITVVVSLQKRLMALEAKEVAHQKQEAKLLAIIDDLAKRVAALEASP